MKKILRWLGDGLTFVSVSHNLRVAHPVVPGGGRCECAVWGGSCVLMLEWTGVRSARGSPLRQTGVLTAAPVRGPVSGRALVLAAVSVGPVPVLVPKSEERLQM